MTSFPLISEYGAITNVGSAKLKDANEHSTVTSCAAPDSSIVLFAAFPSHSRSGGASRLVCEYSNEIFIPASASLCLHFSTASGTASPFDRLTASMATGYHATCPTPRAAVNDCPIWSQSECLA